MLHATSVAVNTTNVYAVVCSVGQPAVYFGLPPCPQKFVIELPVLKSDHTAFEFKAPIELTLYQDDAVWYCEQPGFSILASGETSEKAAHSFCEDFAMLWDEIAQAPDETLTKEAQRVKHALLSAVRSVKVR